MIGMCNGGDMRTCRHCHQEKPASEFYYQSARPIGTCKECQKEGVRLRRMTNPEVQAYDRERNRTPERQAHLFANSKRWREQHPDRYRAQNKVNNAIRDGKLTRSLRCEECGTDGRLHAHHDDYSKPLDVRWLCALCHHRHHAAINA